MRRGASVRTKRRTFMICAGRVSGISEIEIDPSRLRVECVQIAKHDYGIPEPEARLAVADYRRIAGLAPGYRYHAGVHDISANVNLLPD